MPSGRHETAFVTVLGTTSSFVVTPCVPSGRMNSCKIFGSVVWGKPKSHTSSSSSNMTTKLSRTASSSSSPKYAENTEPSRCKKVRIMAALALLRVTARRKTL
eukprot:Amastigsp_a676428_702.p4 type:complete len:103 gc:universal Amastigsp_a676428_702:517-209(-)